MQRLPLWRTMKNAYGAPSSKIICFVWPFFQSSFTASSLLLRQSARLSGKSFPIGFPPTSSWPAWHSSLWHHSSKLWLVGTSLLQNSSKTNWVGFFPTNRLKKSNWPSNVQKKNMTTRNTPKIRPPAEFAQHWTTEPYVCATFSPAPARFQKFITNYGWPKRPTGCHW